MPSISIIIPSYNRKDLLQETLTSLYDVGGDIEIIVVDDGSTDGTLEFLGTQKSIEIVKQENRGAGGARNRGIEIAQGDYMAFLDSDDLWFPWSLKVYQDVIRLSGAEIIFGKPFRFHDTAELTSISPPETTPEWLRFDDYYASGDEWRWWGASSFIFRRDLLVNSRFVETEGEDTDIIMKLGHKIPLAQIVGCPTFAYREHESNVMKDLDKMTIAAWNLARSENAGAYPGGKGRESDRRRILGRHLRPAILDLLKNGRTAEGWSLLRETLPWHLKSRRWRFLAASLALKLKG